MQTKTRVSPPQVVIVIHGSEGSRTVHIESSQLLIQEFNENQQKPTAKLLENETLTNALSDIGTVREVEVK